MAVALQAAAITVNIDTDCSDPSVLAAHIDPSTTDLTLTGRAPAALLKQIPELAPALKSLDMRGLELTPAGIPPYAFASTDIADMQLPASLKTIGEAAFAGSALTAVDTPAGVDSIAPYTFAQCTALTRIAMPSVRHIGKKAFAGCRSLDELQLPASVETIGEEAFTNSAITSADMAQCGRLNSIGDFAFASCQELEQIILPTHIIYIGTGAMMNCPRLTAVEALGALNEIPDLMLASDSLLQSADIAADPAVTSIGSYAFSGAKSIRQLTLPESLEQIGDNAMERMTGLQTINAEALTTVPRLGNDVWAQTPQARITLLTAPETALEFKSTPQWCEFIIADNITTGLNTPGAAEPAVSIAFEGNTMLVTSDSPIGLVTVHDLQGRLRSGTDARRACSIAISTSGWDSDGAYIVSVSTGNKTETRQIIRQNR